jgi:hypothetical protein
MSLFPLKPTSIYQQIEINSNAINGCDLIDTLSNRYD